jgi:hypothetical protein
MDLERIPVMLEHGRRDARSSCILGDCLDDSRDPARQDRNRPEMTIQFAFQYGFEMPLRFP